MSASSFTHPPLLMPLFLFFFLPPLDNDHCEQMEADFPSVSDHSSGLGSQLPTVEEASQESRFLSGSSLSFAISLNTACCLGPSRSLFSDSAWPQHRNSRTNLFYPPPHKKKNKGAFSSGWLGVTWLPFSTRNLFLHLWLSPQLHLF